MFLKSELLTLRNSELRDLDFICSLESEEENAKFIIPWSKTRHEKAMRESDMLHLIIEDGESNHRVGYIIIAGLKNDNLSIELVRITVKDKGKGYGKESFRLIKDWAFTKHNANRLWLDVKVNNSRALHLYQKQGFVIEGTLRECLKSDKGFESLYIMSMLKSEWKNDLLECGKISDTKVKQYLERIRILDDIKVDYYSLQKIQENHMLQIPFENIDIANNQPIKLDLENVFDKIVRKKRGGYCYELNSLLAWFLECTGFQVSILSGKVSRDDGTFGPEFDHMLILVQLEKKYVVDVGFGDSVRSPIPLSGEVVTDVSGAYRIKFNKKSDVYYLQKLKNEEWTSEYEFTLKQRQIKDFNDMNQYQQTSPNSHFTQNLIVSIATPEGRNTISGDSYIKTVKSNKEKIQIHSNEHKKALLKRYFGIADF